LKLSLFLIALLYGLSVSTVAAQSTGATVTGTIRDQFGQVLLLLFPQAPAARHD